MALNRSGLSIVNNKIEQLGDSAYVLSSNALRSKWMPVAILLTASFSFLFRLGQSSLQDWDEAFYAEVAKQMVTSGEYLSQQYGGSLWFEKPPLVPWIMSGAYQLIGVNEFAARVPSAIAGILLSLVIYIIGKNMYSRQVGVLAVVTMLSFYEVLKRGRFATTDMILTLFIYLAILAYLKLDEGNQGWWYVIWVSSALAFMTKFWASLVIPVVLFAAIINKRNLKSIFRSKHFWGGLAIAGILVIPWHLIMLFRHGQSFVDMYVIHNLVNRSATALEGNIGDNFHYFRLMQRMFLPWLYILPISAAIVLRDNLFRTSRSRILLILVTVIILLYSVAVSTKLPWYFLPAYPALAIFIAVTIAEAFEKQHSIAFAGLIFATLMAVLIASNKLVIAYWLLMLPAAFLAVRYIGKLRLYQVATLAMYGFLLFLSVMIDIGGYGYVERIYTPKITPIAQLAKRVDQVESTSNAPILALLLGADRGTDDAIGGPAATYYANQPVEVIGDLEELSTEITGEKEREIMMAKKYLKPLSESYEIHVKAEVDSLVYGLIKTKK